MVDSFFVGKLKSRKLHELEKRLIAYEQAYRCAMCHLLLPPYFDIDHIIPLASSTWQRQYSSVQEASQHANKRTNLQALCCNCHRLKSMREQFHRMNRADGFVGAPPKKSHHISAQKRAHPIPKSQHHHGNHHQRRPPFVRVTRAMNRHRRIPVVFCSL